MQSASTSSVRMQKRYDELIREGKHGHYESMFRVWREENEHLLRENTEMAELIWQQRRKESGNV